MKPDSKKQSQFNTFLDAYVQELIATSDEDVLSGLSPDALKVEALTMLESAKMEAGRRRLVRAKLQLAQPKKAIETPSVSATEARAYLRQAANDARFTLAARELGELSDEDALQLYAQLKALEAEEPSGGEDPA